MKKFAAIFLSLILFVSATFGTVVSAATVLDLEKRTGTLTLTKYEADSNKTKPVSGAVFTAYQVAELTTDGTFKALELYKNVSVTVDGTEWTLEKLMQQYGYSTGNTAGGLTFASTDIFEKMIPALQAVAKDGIASTESAEGTYTFGDLAIGIYLVEETEVPLGYTVASQAFLVSIPEWDEESDTWNYNVTASPKAASVNPEKKVIFGGSFFSEGTVKTGDIINYLVTANIPYYGTALPIVWTESPYYPTLDDFNAKLAEINYSFMDTMEEGLTFNQDLVITIEGRDSALVSGTDYTLTQKPVGNKTQITVDFVWANINKYQGKKITFKYSTTVNEKASIGFGGNKNIAVIKYDSNPQTNIPNIVTDEDETNIYTYGMELTKTFNNVSAEAAGVDASGVEFSLSKDGVKLTFITKDAGKYIVYSKAMSENEAVEGYTITQALHPAADGSLSVDGLDEGDYTLVEENSIKGFSKLASDVIISVASEKVDGAITGKVVATVADTTLALSETNPGKFLFTVNNVSKQFDLPLTGGAGILVFTIGGGIIIAASIIILAQLRKKKSK